MVNVGKYTIHGSYLCVIEGFCKVHSHLLKKYDWRVNRSTVFFCFQDPLLYPFIIIRQYTYISGKISVKNGSGNVGLVGFFGQQNPWPRR